VKSAEFIFKVDRDVRTFVAVLNLIVGFHLCIESSMFEEAIPAPSELIMEKFGSGGMAICLTFEGMVTVGVNVICSVDVVEGMDGDTILITFGTCKSCIDSFIVLDI
jgi:hypothetical protein